MRSLSSQHNQQRSTASVESAPFNDVCICKTTSLLNKLHAMRRASCTSGEIAPHGTLTVKSCCCVWKRMIESSEHERAPKFQNAAFCCVGLTNENKHTNVVSKVLFEGMSDGSQKSGQAINSTPEAPSPQPRQVSRKVHTPGQSGGGNQHLRAYRTKAIH